MSTSSYTPPQVWTWDAESGGHFASINRPIAGATHEQALPRGEHPLQLHSLGTPNGVKVTVLLEELLALGCDAEYDAFLRLMVARDGFECCAPSSCASDAEASAREARHIPRSI